MHPPNYLSAFQTALPMMLFTEKKNGEAGSYDEQCPSVCAWWGKSQTFGLL